MTKVLVCGSRDFPQYSLVCKVLDALPRPLTICQGAANGADIMALRWASEHNVPCRSYSADWKTYGKFAGVKRNEQMLADFSPHLVIAFNTNGDNLSPGTRDMVERARRAGIKVMVVGA